MDGRIPAINHLIYKQAQVENSSASAFYLQSDDQRGCTSAACQPFGPFTTLNCTA